ncbi:MAG: biotin--[acetyl-CoA-carboxylase] ligase [Bradyrhizobiaceae bacterium]|nr:biotin--[acetyl-CoA-carboxylase] ligase [Bradyrhizobiaceae bacterium]
MTDFPATAGGIPVVAFETVGSTNAEALARARAGDMGPLWIAARRQTAGHGRRGRTWVSEPGNLYASLLLADPAPPAAIPGICFVAALALHDALLDVAHGLAPAQLRLKWPNDLLLDGKKIAGVLVEGMSLGGGPTVTVVGFGVNCRHHPANVEFPATDLAAAGYAVDTEALLEALGAALAERLKEWDRGENFVSIRAAWLARAAGIGEAIEARLPNRTVAGIFETVDESGALVLKHRDGTRETIAAGDVFPLTAG